MMWNPESYWLTRLIFERALALVCLIAFLAAVNQFKPLLGEHGLLPVTLFVKQAAFKETPSLFFFYPKDIAFTTAAWIGVVLSCVVLTGVSDRFGNWFSALVWAAIWVLYLSFVNVGQIFYAFGWESILLEACFFSMFLWDKSTAAPKITIWILRWLLFRVLFGAGLIKIRGDACWRDLTCLNYYFETQPIPNPLSWYFHWMPHGMLRAGVAFNHFCELIVPFAYFLPQPVSSIAGLITIVFQGSIMLSGNLSWLNFLTIVLAIPTLDDRILSWIIPINVPQTHAPHIAQTVIVAVIAAIVAVLSIQPIRNMISSRQIMNTNFNPFHLVGTYGAFGSITRQRFEVIVQGTTDTVLTPATKWHEYEFKGKPGDTKRMPPQIAPYHLRLDWLMWFAAMSPYYSQPWFVHFIGKLLEGDKPVLNLLKTNPFGDQRPRYVRALQYEYHFSTPKERAANGEWWKREPAGTYFPAVSLDDARFREVLESQGWLEPQHSR